MELKMIKVRDETHAELDSIGERGETFDQIIWKCIKAYKEKYRK